MVPHDDMGLDACCCCLALLRQGEDRLPLSGKESAFGEVVADVATDCSSIMA